MKNARYRGSFIKGTDGDVEASFGIGEIHRLRNNKNPFFEMERERDCRVICTRNFPNREYSLSLSLSRISNFEIEFRSSNGCTSYSIEI